MTPVRDQRQHAVISRATGSWCTCLSRCRWTTRCTRHGWPLPAPSRSSPGHPDGRGTAAAGVGDALLPATLIAANDARRPWPTSFGKVTPPEDIIAYRMMWSSQAHAGPESRCPSGAVQARERHLPTISWTAAAMGMATRAPITPNRAPPSRTANNRPSLEPNGIRVGSGPHDLPRGSHPNCHKPIGHADRRRECSGPDGVRWPFRYWDGGRSTFERSGLMSGQHNGPAIAELTESHDSLSAAQADENGQNVLARSPAAGVLGLPGATAEKLLPVG